MKYFAKTLGAVMLLSLSTAGATYAALPCVFDKITSNSEPGNPQASIQKDMRYPGIMTKAQCIMTAFGDCNADQASVRFQITNVGAIQAGGKWYATCYVYWYPI
ncbi:hypothetical protein [Fluoribacter gormanii]|uniref:hypothetical protein n=1 Tax=Fluoribacter gormanii TaxID=464 RepID=UPI0010418786|nr:hypothetical protein [Fluoribacter gormanii]